MNSTKPTVKELKKLFYNMHVSQNTVSTYDLLVCNRSDKIEIFWMEYSASMGSARCTGIHDDII